MTQPDGTFGTPPRPLFGNQGATIAPDAPPPPPPPPPPPAFVDLAPPGVVAPPVAPAQPSAPPASVPPATSAPVVVQTHDQPVVVEPGPVGASGGHLATRGVSCWFSGRKVLEQCSLTMEPGRVTALIGPSGCGKSTYLRTLNRMHELVPGAELGGAIELDGVDIYGPQMAPAEVRSRIGMVFQKPNPFPAMSIAENVLAGLKLTGISTSGRDDLVESSLRRAGLWEEVKDRLDDGGMSLSGGQQQRLCIARAIAVSPEVLLMDEPCSALDPVSTRVIEDTIRSLCNDVTIVIVTHNMQQAQRVSDDCAFFMIENMGSPGRIVEAGLTEMMFSSPEDPRTLDYVTGRFG